MHVILIKGVRVRTKLNSFLYILISRRVLGWRVCSMLFAYDGVVRARAPKAFPFYLWSQISSFRLNLNKNENRWSAAAAAAADWWRMLLFRYFFIVTCHQLQSLLLYRLQNEHDFTRIVHSFPVSQISQRLKFNMRSWLHMEHVDANFHSFFFFILLRSSSLHSFHRVFNLLLLCFSRYVCSHMFRRNLIIIISLYVWSRLHLHILRYLVVNFCADMEKWIRIVGVSIYLRWILNSKKTKQKLARANADVHIAAHTTSSRTCTSDVWANNAI